MTDMSPANWYRHHIPTFWRDTSKLDPFDTGMLMKLRAGMHDQGYPLREDYEQLGRLCGTTKRKAQQSVTHLIENGLIERLDGGLWCEAMQREFEYRADKSEKGKAAAERLWQKRKQNQSASDADAMLDRGRDREGDAHQGHPPSSNNSNSEYEATPPEFAPEGASGASDRVSEEEITSRAIYDGNRDPLAFLKSIRRTTLIGFKSSTARNRMIAFMASSIEHASMAETALQELFDKDELTKGTAHATLQGIWKEYGGEIYVKKA